MKQRKALLLLAVLILVYSVVILGVLAYGSDVLILTPAVILIAAFITGWLHGEVDGRFVAYISIVFVSAFVIAAVGVNTGSIFGQYFYGKNLGFKLLDTPIIIGLYWLLLSYCSSVLIGSIAKIGSLNTALGKALLAALVMVSMDVMIEQIASLADFWYWKNQSVPIQNYTAWFAFSTAFNYLFQKLQIDIKNPLAKWVLALQALFCLGLSILL